MAEERIFKPMSHIRMLHIGLAKEIGLKEALFLQQVHCWLLRSKNKVNGSLWVWKNLRDWIKELPFFSEPTLKRTTKELRELGIIRVGDYNKKKDDHTNWYTINYDHVALKRCGWLDDLERIPRGENSQMTGGENSPEADEIEMFSSAVAFNCHSPDEIKMTSSEQIKMISSDQLRVSQSEEVEMSRSYQSIHSENTTRAQNKEIRERATARLPELFFLLL